jgi:uncharacterized protein YkwD
MLRGMTTRTLSALNSLFLLALLAGCGGGGANATSTASPPPSPPASPSAPTPPAPPPTVSGTRATCNLANFASEALLLVNQHRAAGASCGDRGTFPAVAALAWNDPLTQASLVHSDDMMSNNFFSHTGSNGASAGDRATAAGYVWQTWGENIAAGQPTVASVVQAWMNSPGHCANIMNASMRDIGLACVSGGAANTYRTYWTMTLGAAR